MGSQKGNTAWDMAGQGRAAICTSQSIRAHTQKIHGGKKRQSPNSNTLWHHPFWLHTPCSQIVLKSSELGQPKALLHFSLMVNRS